MITRNQLSVIGDGLQLSSRAFASRLLHLLKHKLLLSTQRQRSLLFISVIRLHSINLGLFLYSSYLYIQIDFIGSATEKPNRAKNNGNNFDWSKSSLRVFDWIDLSVLKINLSGIIFVISTNILWNDLIVLVSCYVILIHRYKCFKSINI